MSDVMRKLIVWEDGNEQNAVIIDDHADWLESAVSVLGCTEEQVNCCLPNDMMAHKVSLTNSIEQAC